MKKIYFIHTPEDWHAQDVSDIKRELDDVGFLESKDAAIGEGAGGSGFESFVEVLIDFFNNPIVQNIAAAVIWDVAKTLWKRKRINKRLPKGLSDVYKLIVHIQGANRSTIVSIDLNAPEHELETAVRVNLQAALKGHPSRLVQNKDGWSAY